MKTWKNLGIFAISALSLGVVACSGSDGAKGDPGAAGAAGATGPAGDATPKSVGVVVPNIGLLDRELDVTITTNGIDFTKAAPTVDLGAGVTVSNIQVLSSTTIYAHVAVDAAAATGTRDVKVTEGSDTLTSTKGFKVAAPMTVTSNPGLKQGQLGDIIGDNLDLLHAFDPNSFTFIVPDGVLAVGPPTVSATHADGFYLVDPAAPASLEVEGANLDLSGAPAPAYAGDAPIAIATTTPVTVTPGTPLTGQAESAAGVNAVFKYTSAAVSIMEVNVTATGAQAQPVAFVYGDSGLAKDMEDNQILSQQNFGGPIIYPSLANKSGYVTVLDLGGGGSSVADFGFTVSAIAHTGTLFAEPATAHETAAHAATNALIPALPAAGTNNGAVVTGALASGAEVDYYAVNLTNADNVELVFTPGFNGAADLVDVADNSILPNGLIFEDLKDGTAAPTATGTATSTTQFYVKVISDGTAKGNYTFSLRKRP